MGLKRFASPLVFVMTPSDFAALWRWLPFAAGSLALAAMGIWFLRPGVARWELPPQRTRAVPWGGAELCGIFLLIVLQVWAALLSDGLRLVANALDNDSFVGDTPQSRLRCQLWGGILALPLQLGSILLVVHLVSGTRLYQLGLHTSRWGRNVLVGFLAWATFTPFILTLYETTVWLVNRLGLPEAENHPLTRFHQEGGNPLDGLAIVLTAVIAAPLSEELVFRGLLLPWTARRSWRGWLVLGLAVAVTGLLRWGHYQTALAERGIHGLLVEMIPLFAMGTVASGVGLVRLVWRRDVAQADPMLAIAATALLFAAMHSSWPSPVPLFLLGLVLGYVSYRTASLVPSIVLHALFNAVSCVMLFFPWLIH